jgi:CspA family cold shock protein
VVANLCAVQDRRERTKDRIGHAVAAAVFLCGPPGMRCDTRENPFCQEDQSLASGTVKWFNDQKGYGFIAQDSGGDVFVHYSGIEGSGFRSLSEGERVEFEVVPGDKGPQAKSVRKLTTAAVAS